MNLLQHSNSLRRINIKKKRTPREIAKIILFIILSLLLFGFVFQKISNFVAKETLNQTVDYSTVNNRRMDFRLLGNGDYTVVFDNCIGANLEQWTPIIEELKDDNVFTFVYNRRGYGYSDNGPFITPEEQAQELKILLRKAGAPEPYILVGEEYGSLVLSSLAEQFPDSIGGVVLVNPIDESKIGTREFKTKNILNKIRLNIEDIGGLIGVTTLIDNLNLDLSLPNFENNLTGDYLKEFKTQRTKKSYTSAVKNEFNVLLNGTNIMKENMFKDKPYYLIVKEENKFLESLTSSKSTKVNIIKNKKNFVSLTSPENVVVGIRYVLGELRRAKINNQA